MDTQRICPNCHKPLAPDVPLGLCPDCLIEAGFPSGVESGSESGEGRRPPFLPPAVEELSSFFPQLEILELLGSGGMGAVYKARQKELDRFVALKILPPGIGHAPAFAERFAREAKALAKLNHPGVVTLYEFGRADGLFYFLMEFVDGVNLRQLLQAGRVAPREALAIVPQICDALQYAHDQGIVHRDIKPANILLDRQGRVKVADFGLARLMGIEAATAGAAGGKETSASVTLTESGKIMGTPSYMAPEQKDRPLEVDHRADIYSLGVVLYQMLTGELPGKLIEPPSRKVQLDVRLDEVVLRALEKKPERRYQQVSEVKNEVETIAATAPGSSGRESAPTGVRSQRAAATARSNAKEATIVLFGTCWFAFLLAVVVELSRASVVPFKEFFIVLAIVGLGICALSLAGLWPFPSPWFPEPNFSSRNLRRWKAEADSESGQKPRLSRTAIWGAVVATFPLLLLALPAYIVFVSIVGTARGVSLVFMLLFGFIGFVGALPTTILGWVAVSQIRRSAGRLYGLGLAVFDGLLFPLLALDCLVVLLGCFVAEGFEEFQVYVTKPWLAIPIVAALTIDYLIVRVVWRAVNSPLSDATHPSLPAPIRGKQGGRVLKAALVTLIAVAAIVFVVIPIGGILLGILLPAINKARNAADKTQETASAVQFSFGPVVERVLYSVATQRPIKGEDLDNGREVEVPAEMEKAEEGQFLHWVAAHGVDIMAFGHEHERVWELWISSKVTPLLSPTWDNATRADLLAALAEWDPNRAGLMRTGPDTFEGFVSYYLTTNAATLPINFATNAVTLPMNFAFETQAGGLGVLQIAGFTDSPFGVKIRYKLVRGATVAAMPYAGSDPDAGAKIDSSAANLNELPVGKTSSPARLLSNGEYSQDFQMTFPLARDGHFALDNPNGSIEITGWDGPQVLIKGVKHGKKQKAVETTKIDVESGADHVAVHTRVPRKLIGWGNENVTVDYTIRVPRAARLEKIANANGNVVIEDVAGDIAASIANGSVRAKGSAGDLKLSTANGSITAEPASLSGDQSISLDTANGSITATLPANANATVTADTSNGGIASEFAALTLKKDFPTGSHLKGMLGNGSANVRARTSNGKITLRRGKEAR